MISRNLNSINFAPPSPPLFLRTVNYSVSNLGGSPLSESGRIGGIVKPHRVECVSNSNNSAGVVKVNVYFEETNGKQRKLEPNSPFGASRSSNEHDPSCMITSPMWPI